MAKRYRVKWTPVVEIKECRGLKRTENPITVEHKENYIENILLVHFLAILQKNIETRNSLNEWRISLKKAIRSFTEEGLRQEGTVLYCDQQTVSAEDIRQMLAWYHRQHAAGSYHLFDEKRMIVRKGQLVVPKEYRKVSLNRPKKPYMTKRFRAWKRKVAFVFSQWEMDEVVNLLLVDAICAPISELSWAREVYGERIDYVPSLQTKDIIPFFYWHLMEPER